MNVLSSEQIETVSDLPGPRTVPRPRRARKQRFDEDVEEPVSKRAAGSSLVHIALLKVPRIYAQIERYS